MAALQGLRAAHSTGESVVSIKNKISGGANAAINKTDAVFNGARLFFFPFVDTSSDLWLGGEIIRREIKQAAEGVNELAKDANDDERS